MNRLDEWRVKLARVRGLMEARGLSTLVLASEANAFWLGGGPPDGADPADVRGSRIRIWQETEGGVAAFLVTRDAVRLWTENIEMPRLLRDEFAGLPVEPIVEDWRRSDLAAAVRSVTPPGGAVGLDLALPPLLAMPGAVYLAPAVAALRASLTPRELDRYRWLCRRAAAVMTDLFLIVEPGWTEARIHAEALRRLAEAGIDQPVPIVTCDDRLLADRHGLYGDHRLHRLGMVVFCARKWGLVACLTRFVSFGPLTAQEVERHAAVRRVARAVIDATRPGVPLAELFSRVLVPAYAREGYPDGTADHHQGGPTGYAGRDVRVDDRSPGAVAPEQAFAWNPSLPAAKSEDTVVARADGTPELLTADPAWPLDPATGLADVLVR